MKSSFKFKDAEVYPLDASKSGKNATHVNGCHVVGQSQPYAACLKRIADYEAGDQLESMRECTRAIGGSACRAWVMRQEEIKAGASIHFTNRDKLNAYVGVVASDLAQRVLSNVRPTVESAPPQWAEESPAAFGGYADAINATIQTLSSPATSGQTEHLEPTNQQEQE
jgi:hypothetical protein